MSYGRKLKPRFYVSRPDWLIHRGEASVITVDAANDIAADVSILRAFDGQPSVRCSWPTLAASSADEIVTKIDLKNSSSDVSYVAILNHNMLDANAGFTLWGSDTDDYAASTPITLSALVGLGGSSPADNGSHVVLCSTPTNYRYYWLVIGARNEGGYDDDLEIGHIMLGSYYTAPHGPDVGITSGVIHDGGKMLETRGGQRHYISGWTTGADGQSLPFGPPFKTNTIASGNYNDSVIQPGRRFWKFSLSYLADTTVAPEDLSSGFLSPDCITNLFASVGGEALPFIFTPDSTSTTVGDYAFARFAEDTIEPEEVAHRMFTVKLSVEEEF